MRRKQSRQLAAIAMLLGIMLVLQVFSNIFFAVFPFPIKPTIIHIPVIIGAILYGPRVGASLGFLMGIMSLITNTVMPTPNSFLFSPLAPGGNFVSLIIAILPRVLIGITPYYIYKWVHNRLGMALAGLTGSLTNTVFVLGSIFLLFSNVFQGDIMKLLAAVVATNSLWEMALAAFLTAAIVPVLEKAKR